MIVVRQVLQHLPLATGLALMRHAKATNARWLAATSNPLWENKEVEPGDYFRGPNLQAAPFLFGKEEALCGTPHPVEDQEHEDDNMMLFDLDSWVVPGESSSQAAPTEKKRCCQI